MTVRRHRTTCLLLLALSAASWGAAPARETPWSDELALVIGQLNGAPAAERPDALRALIVLHERLREARDATPSADLDGAITSSGWRLYQEHPRDPSIDPVRVLTDAREGALATQHSSSIGVLSMTLAHEVRNRGDVRRAERLLREAVAAIPDGERVGWKTRVELADLLRHRGEVEATRELLDGVERGLATDLEYRPRLIGDVFGIRALLDLHEGRPERAALTIEAALALARASESPEIYLNAVFRRLNLALAVEDAVGALDLIDDTLTAEWLDGRITSRHRAQLAVRRGHALAELERDLPDRPREAAAVLEDVIASGDLNEDARTDAVLTLAEVHLRDRDFVATEERLSEVADPSTAEDPIDAAGDRLRQRRRHAVLTAALARLRGDGPVSLRQARDRLAAEYAAFVERWRAAPTRPDGRGFLHFGGPRQLCSELILLEVELDPTPAGVERAFDHVLAGQALGTVTRSRDGGVVTTDVARRMLGADELLFVYLPAPDRSHLFALDASRPLEHHALAADMRIFEARRTFLTSVAGGPATTDRARAERRDRATALRRLLLPDPLFDAARRRHDWTIVGVDLLGMLPFEALPAGADSWIGLEHALVYLPSIPLGVALRAEPPRNEGDVEFALVAAPSHGDSVRERWPQLPELTLGDGEVERLAGAYVADERTIVRGPDATAARLATEAARSRRVLHVWTHGVYEPVEPVPAGLVTSDGAIFGADAATLDVPPLVVLSACGAARGPVRRGDDGVSNLGGAFLRAGARAVVLPEADVDEGATLALMGAFHRRLRGSGETVAEAMRAARAELADVPALDDPFYFALVHVVGAGHESVFPAAPSRRWPWIVVAFALTIGLLVIRRRAS